MKLRLVVGSLFAAALALLITWSPQAKEKAKTPIASNGIGAGSLYAYENNNDVQVEIANGPKVFASQEGQSPAFSPNGRYVMSSDANAVYLYDTRSRLKYKRSYIYQPPSNCFPQAISNSYLYVADPELIRYRLPGFSHGTLVPAHLPSGPVCPIGTVGDDALVALGAGNRWELYEVSPTGASRHLGRNPFLPTSDGLDMNLELFAPTDKTSDGDPALAYDYWNGNGYSVSLLDIRTDKTIHIGASRLKALSPGRSAAGTAVYVEDMWWSGDGKLCAIMSSYSKNAPGPLQQMWQLSGYRWVRWDSQPLVSDRPMSNGDAVMVLANPLSREDIGIYSGELYLVARSGSELLQKKLYGSIVIPADEAGNPPHRL
jgi:hypothetical protein